MAPKTKCSELPGLVQAFLKEKEDEVVVLREKLKEAHAENREKDREVAKDSKLVMQLTKKLEESHHLLEALLMDNEDLQ
jgi:predicted RNase H-like nuclease (RuvC/YqgF family)